MFDAIFEIVKNEFMVIQYATNSQGVNETNVLGNYEKMVVSETDARSYFLDFYVADVNRVIEFDGTFWHMNQWDKDAARDAYLKSHGFPEILRVPEVAFRKNPHDTVMACVKFLRYGHHE